MGSVSFTMAYLHSIHQIRLHSNYRRRAPVDAPQVGPDWRNCSRQENVDLRHELAEIKRQAAYDAHHTHQEKGLSHDAAMARIKQLEVENHKLRGMMGNGDRVPALNDEIARLKAENEELRRVGTEEIERLLCELNQHNQNKDANGLGPEFDFGRRVFQCEISSSTHGGTAGVAYRRTPVYSDKNDDGKGPEAPECIIADAICQGPQGIFVRCTSGRGWLPLNPPGFRKHLEKETVCFKMLGKVEDVHLEGLLMSGGKNKLDGAP